jgi:hypothetical protein
VPTAEQWKAFLADPKMNRPARKRRVRNIFPALHEWFMAAHPKKERHIALVLDALDESWFAGISCREWAARARLRLRLEFADEVMKQDTSSAQEGD